jgi:hypothetical protein
VFSVLNVASLSGLSFLIAPLVFSIVYLSRNCINILLIMYVFFSQRIQLKYKELQQQQRQESENFKEEINILTAEKESLATVVSQITNQ